MNVFSTDYAEYKISRKWLLDHLLYGPVYVKFKKNNGEEREMKCTLKESIIVPYKTKTGNTKKFNPDVLPVWDIDKKEWRSFRYDSILSINFDIN